MHQPYRNIVSPTEGAGECDRRPRGTAALAVVDGATSNGPADSEGFLDPVDSGVRRANLRVFADGEDAFAEILRRIDGAKRSIGIKAFLWHDDHVGNEMARRLLRAADRGVNVTIHKDRVAALYEYTGGNKQSFFHKRLSPGLRLQAWVLGRLYRSPGSARQRPNRLITHILAHPNIRVSSRHKRFDHAKLFVVDDRYLILGSMGIADAHHNEWADVMVEVEGRAHCRRLEQRLAGEVGFDPGRGIDFLVHSHLVNPRRSCPMLGARLMLIDAARHSLTVEMAYLGDRRFTAALEQAVMRGVDVTLITSARANLLGNLNLAVCDTLLARAAGRDNLRIFLMPRMVHTKMVVADHSVSDVGSANFTPLSNGVYEEINLYVRDAAFAARLEEIAQTHMFECEQVRTRVGYRKLAANVERAVMAFQARKGA